MNPDYESREDARVWEQIGDVYWRERQFDLARRAWERARLLRPGHPRLRAKLTAVDTGRDPLAVPAYALVSRLTSSGDTSSSLDPSRTSSGT